jgi:hypothetical protein
MADQRPAKSDWRRSFAPTSEWVRSFTAGVPLPRTFTVPLFDGFMTRWLSDLTALV